MKRSPDSLWSRIRHGRLVQVLLVYVGASWAILEAIQLLRETLQLPLWVGPTAFVLLVAGLVVILGTAWVQSHPLVDRREEADEVPGSWELDVAEFKESLSHGRFPHLTWARAALGGIFAFALLFGLAGLYVLFQDRGNSLAPPLPASEAAPGIAVLPFGVSGPDPEGWGETLVHAVATNLDGVAGLRAINSRTLLARWREEVPEGTTPDEATLLNVARRTGSRYAVSGSVMTASDRTRVVAKVYDLENDSSLGVAQVDGAADSVFAVVDQLSGEVLRRIVGERVEIPEIDLARATTASLPALKAFLEGEVHLRHGRWGDAAGAYRRAVADDSAFVLAWMRLRMTTGWGNTTDLAEDAAVHVNQLTDRLPEREALLARGLIPDGRPETLEGLRMATRKYPDDPLAWYLLGEFVYHQGAAFLADPAESIQAFNRANELDPSFTASFTHLIREAITQLDSARAAVLLDSYEGVREQDYRFAQAIAFGDDSTRARLLAVLDTVSGIRLPLVAELLGHPRLLDLQARVFEAAPGSRRAQFHFNHGQIEAGLTALEHPQITSWERPIIAYWAHTVGLTIPEDRLNHWLAAASASSLDEQIQIEFVRGAWALERGNQEDYRQARSELETIAEQAEAADDSVHHRYARGAVWGLQGFAAWRADQLEEAERTLEKARVTALGYGGVPEINRIIRWWLAGLALENGRTERAAELHFWPATLGDGSGIRNSMAALHLATLREQMGRLDEARANYGWFVSAYRHADPELQPLVQDATSRLAALKSEAD